MNQRKSSFHPYWNAITYYFTRSSTSTSSIPQVISPSPSPSPPLLFPIQPPPQNPYYTPNPINTPYVVCDNSIFPLNFTIESINNLANIFRSSSRQAVAYRSSSTFSTFSTSSSISHVTSVYDDDESYNGIKGKGCNFSHNTCTELSPRISSSTLNFNLSPSSSLNLNLNSSSSLNFNISSSNFNLNSFPIPSPLNIKLNSSSSSYNFNLNSSSSSYNSNLNSSSSYNFNSNSSSSSYNFNLNTFPYTLSSLERYEIQIRIEGKITSTNIISPRQLNKLLIKCKKDHKTRTNSQGNLYCKKKKNVYHYHNLSNGSFYSKREDGSSIYVDQSGEIIYKTKEQENSIN
ncbi:8271_t:CDS:2 [Rhizophagus irregularis]|nr:8271_t:CDS:2 [Rhizophagus irregularis]